MLNAVEGTLLYVAVSVLGPTGISTGIWTIKFVALTQESTGAVSVPTVTVAESVALVPKPVPVTETGMPAVRLVVPAAWSTTAATVGTGPDGPGNETVPCTGRSRKK